MDAKSYAGSSSKKVLEWATKLKKDEYEAPCIKKMALICSFGLLGGWDGVQGGKGVR